MSESFDFVIVGSGGGSMCSALMMRSAGKRAVILEKTEMVGGTTSISGGVMWIPNNRFMRADGIKDSEEQAMAYLDAVVGDSDDTPSAKRAKRLAYIRQSNEMLEFLISKGIKFRRNPYWPDYYDAPGSSAPGRTVSAQLFDINRLGDWKDKMRPFALPLPAYLDEAMGSLANIKRSWAARGVLLKVMGRAIRAKLKGQRLVTGGNAIQGQMVEAALKAGVDIRLNTPVKRIVVEDGRAVGVIVEKDGTEQRIDARLGILINAGGYARNQQMLDRYIPGMSAENTNVGPGDTGEMIEAGGAAGAALVQMDGFIGGQVTLPPGSEGSPHKPMVQGDMAKPHALVVDQGGERFVSESSNYTDFTRAQLERNRQKPAIPSWMVFDSQYIDTYMLAGTMAGAKKPQAWYDAGYLHQANSIEELATGLDIDPAKLRATVDRFNGFARNGHDEDFHRGDSVFDKFVGDSLTKTTLGTVEKGPFYAIPVYPGDVGTFGGMLTDEYARVLREDGSPIPGLYATGTSAASVMGKASPAAGVNVGQSFTWGYVAAKHAANLDNAATAQAAE
jgi:3-oxosteroid 1-dehydrogenase